MTATEAYEELCWAERSHVADDGPSVSYPITLLLDRLQGEIGNIRQDLSRHLDRIEAKLDAKADRSDLTALSQRVTILETSATAHAAEAATTREHQQVARGWKQWVPMALIGAATCVILFLQLTGK